jgi:hypothetical protein
MYRSAADALLGLVSGVEREVARLPWKLKMSERPSTMENGIDYFYVEVTFGNGVQYGIPAYGEEARELRERAVLLHQVERDLVQPLIAQ